MIIVHHLNNSRSQRVLWMLEELGLDYEIKPYQRQPSMQAPDSLRAVHPLGKAPVMTDGDKTLASRQIAQAWIAESRAEIDAARLMVLNAAWTIEKKGFTAAREQVSLIKFYVANVMLGLVDRAIQLHGALGITSDTVLAHYYVHERGARIYDGPDEVHKMVVAKRILARYS